MKTTTLVLFGRTGNGKSSTGNSILGYNAFTTKRSSKSVTKKCQVGQRKWKDCQVINVIDTPGLFDTEAKKNFIETEIVRCIDLAKDGVHGFILVLSIQNRFTDEEANAFEKLQYLFGPKLLDYMTVVFTGGDQLEDECQVLDEYLRDTSSNLKKLISRCEKRVVVFDNKTKSEATKQRQISELLQIVEANVAENGDYPYTNELFEKAKSMASQYYNMQGNDGGCQEKVKLLNDMMAKNVKDTKEKMEAMKKGLEEQLKDVETQKDTFRDEICHLRKELVDARKKLASINEIEEDKCSKSCSIL